MTEREEECWSVVRDALGAAFDVTDEEGGLRIEVEAEDGVATVVVTLAALGDALWLTVDSAVCATSDIDPWRALARNGRMARGRVCVEDGAVIVRHTEELVGVTGNRARALVVTVAAEAAGIAGALGEGTDAGSIFSNWVA